MYQSFSLVGDTDFHKVLIKLNKNQGHFEVSDILQLVIKTKPCSLTNLRNTYFRNFLI